VNPKMAAIDYSFLVCVSLQVIWDSLEH
jgi:hypothetical protein